MSDPSPDQSSEPTPARSGTPLWHWGVIAAAFIVVLNFASIRDTVGGPIDYDANVAGDVTLYSTTWCGYCKKVRNMFAHHDIPFKEIDVEKDPGAARAFQQVGGRGVPVVTIGDRIVHGFNYSRLRKLLECGDCE